MKCLLLYNPTSGKGKFKEELPLVKEIMKEKGHTLDVFLPSSREETFEKAKELASIYDCFLVAGGDGTLNTVINGVMNSKFRPKILSIPRGTTNDMAIILGVGKDIRQNLDLLDEEPIKTDLGKINEHYFCYALACGAFTSVTYEIERKNVKKYGYFAYLKQCIKQVGKNKKTEYKISYDIGEVSGDYCLLMMLNSKRVARFNLRLFSEAKMNDGILELRLLKGMGILNAIKIAFFFIFSGRLFRKDKQIISNSFFIETDSNVVWNVDGEKGPSGSVEIRVCQEALEFYVSKKSKKKYYLKTEKNNNN